MLFKQLFKVLTLILVLGRRSESSVEMAKPSIDALKETCFSILDRIKIGLSDQSTSNSVIVTLLGATITLKVLDIAEIEDIDNV